MTSEPVYKNLEREMTAQNISEEEMASMAGIPQDVFYHCMRGNVPFMFFYCTRIKRILNTKTPLEILFKRTH